MDFAFTPEQEELRREFESFFAEEMKSAPEHWQMGIHSVLNSTEGWDFHRRMAKKLGERGWLTLSWPKQYGGKEMTLIERMIYFETAAYYMAPGTDIWGTELIGPTILQFGTEEQKAEHLPRIASGDVMWCQGWSEPNAGSDLAALSTRAVEREDCFVINGQKIWTTGAHFADWIFVLARTDPEQSRHRGLSVFLVDAKTLGIVVRPLRDFGGYHTFNEVFFDDVRVPKNSLLGEKDRGWYVTLATMNFERSVHGGRIGEIRRAFDELVEYCRTPEINGRTPADNPLVRNRVAQLAIEVRAMRLLSYRISWLAQKGELTAEDASVSKIFSSELLMRIAYTGMQTLGLYGQLRPSSEWVKLKGTFEDLYNSSIGEMLAGGSSEIQRNIIAWWGLQLPRG